MSERPFQKKRGSTASSFSEFRASSGRSAGPSRKPNRDDKARGRFSDDRQEGGRFNRDDNNRSEGRFNDRRSEAPRDRYSPRPDAPSRGYTPRDSDNPRPSYNNNRSEGRFNDRGREDTRGRFNRSDSKPQSEGRFNDRRSDERRDSRGFKPRDNSRPAYNKDRRSFSQDKPKRFNDRAPRNVDRSGNNGYERKKSFNDEPRRTFGKKEVKEFRLQGIFEYGNDFCTPNAVPGQSVYGERFCKDANGAEYRIWDPKRSKLGAALRKGVSQIGMKPGSTVLYLGCSTGTTVSHVGEIVGEKGKVYALDVAPRVLRDLLFTTEKRENIYPLMADASKPTTFSHAVPKVDVVFMDIAQKDQVGIFLKNIKTFLKPGGFGLLSLKSRSVDITKRPVQVFKESRESLEKETVIVDYKELDPYEIDHAFFVVKKKGGKVGDEVPLPDNLKPELN